MSRFRNLVQDTEAMVRVANPGRSFGISITLPRLHFKRTEKQLQRIQRVADQLKQVSCGNRTPRLCPLALALLPPWLPVFLT